MKFDGGRTIPSTLPEIPPSTLSGTRRRETSFLLRATIQTGPRGWLIHSPGQVPLWRPWRGSECSQTFVASTHRDESEHGKFQANRKSAAACGYCTRPTTMVELRYP